MDNPELIGHIRKRPAMYLGDLGLRGFKAMLGYLFEELIPQSDLIVINIEFKVDDVIFIEILNIDTKPIAQTLLFENKGDQFNFLGLRVIIALSEHINISIQTPPSLVAITGKRGVSDSFVTTCPEENKKLLMEFKLDYDIFNKFDLDYEIITAYIRKFAFLNSNFKIKCIDSRSAESQIRIFNYPRGIAHQLDYILGKQLYAKVLFRFERKVVIDNYTYEICFAYIDIWLTQSYISTYDNNTELILGGSLVNGIIDGIVSAIKEIAEKMNEKIFINSKKAKEQLVLIASVKGKDFVYKGSTKSELDMPKMKKQVKNYIQSELMKHFNQNEDIAKRMVEKYMI